MVCVYFRQLRTSAHSVQKKLGFRMRVRTDGSVLGKYRLVVAAAYRHDVIDFLRFIPGIFLLGESPPPKKKNLQFPHAPNGCRIVCSKSFFFGRDNELQTYHGNFLLTDSKHRKLIAIKQSERCKFMPKRTKYVWRPGSARTR